MSLKSFHIVFIVLAVLSSLGFSVWVFARAGAELGSSLGVLGAISAVAAAALAIYGVWFVVRKSSRLII